MKLKLKRSVNKEVCLVFLNGCHTAVGSAEEGFLEVTGNTGFCGFLGVETVVPDIFAWRFGMAFFYYFFTKGWTVAQVMQQLRGEHWPLSLLYSAYCHPELRVKPSVKDKMPEIQFSNFSEKMIGTSKDKNGLI
jgi:hypothetical protein